MQFFDLFVKYSRILLRPLPLIWQAALREVTFVTFSMVVQGIVPKFSI